MRNVQRFSLIEAIDYGFWTYFRNYQFFLKALVVMLSIGFAAVYFGQSLFMAELLEKFPFVIVIIWQMLLDVLVLKSYDNSKLLRLKNFLKYDFNIGYYLLYAAFINCIESLSIFIEKIPAVSGFSSKSLMMIKIVIWIFRLFILVIFFWGKYLILDKKLTFVQSIRATPYLVYGEKIKLAWSWVVCGFLGMLPMALSSYLLFNLMEKYCLAIMSASFFMFFYYPISGMMLISIYKQLMASADEDFKTGIAYFEEDNKLVDDQYL